MNMPLFLAVARGEQPADLILKNGRILNVFTGEIENGDVAIAQGKIAGIGPGYRGAESIDIANSFIAPGLIDAHVHIESSLCSPAHFASAVLPRGVTTVIADPHEIANVAGVAGIRFMAESRTGVQLQILLMAPSCVPATSMGTSGASLSAADLAPLLSDGTVHGLAEVMNFPAVIGGDAVMLEKLAAFYAHPIDGHCPQVSGLDLNGYIAAGIHTDHESINLAEAQEKLARGLYVLIREATNARNLQTLLPLMTPKNNRRICFCTDDRTPADLLREGGIDMMVRRAFQSGVDPIDVVRAATLNTAEAFGLHDRGAISPGRRADLWVFDDLKNPAARQVFVAGQPVLKQTPGVSVIPPAMANTCRIDFSTVNFRIPAKFKRVRVIGAMKDQLVTEQLIMDAHTVGGLAEADPQHDLLKIAVIERHRATGNIGLGFIHGFGFTRGAIAGTVAHDHHNLVVIGADDRSMLTAVRAAARGGGGLAVADGERILAHLPLPIAGLMSDQPIEKVRLMYEQLLAQAASLGSAFADPFMAMSFMALEVIPKLKITDQGLVDVEKFAKVDLFV